MESFSRNFILASIFYFSLMTLIGFAMALDVPGIESLYFAHVHFGLLGWMSMMIFGVGYHVLPRFTGRPLYSRRLGPIHWVLANIGLIGMAVFFPLKVGNELFLILFIVFSVVETLSIIIFAYNLTMTLCSRRILPMAGSCGPGA
jgi:hypothetical protein